LALRPRRKTLELARFSIGIDIGGVGDVVSLALEKTEESDLIPDRRPRRTVEGDVICRDVVGAVKA
jgi:hypothetical protein